MRKPLEHYMAAQARFRDAVNAAYADDLDYDDMQAILLRIARQCEFSADVDSDREYEHGGPTEGESDAASTTVEPAAANR